MTAPPAIPDEDFCYVTTTGRRTGRPHTVEIWFAAREYTIYILSGEGADWVRNARARPRVGVRIGARTYEGRARAPRDEAEDALARRLLLAKYEGPRGEEGLGGWAAGAHPVAIDLEAPDAKRGPQAPPARLARDP